MYMYSRATRLDTTFVLELPAAQPLVLSPPAGPDAAEDAPGGLYMYSAAP